jgi:hypothetical protein
MAKIKIGSAILELKPGMSIEVMDDGSLIFQQWPFDGEANPAAAEVVGTPSANFTVMEDPLPTTGALPEPHPPKHGIRLSALADGSLLFEPLGVLDVLKHMPTADDA